MKTLRVLLFLSIVSLAIASCQKGDKGDTGPAGTNGTNGTNGNANVIDTFFNAANWFNAAGNYTEWTYDYVNTAYDFNGLVQVYFYDGGNNWMAMPFTYHSLEWLYEVYRDTHTIHLTMTTVGGTQVLSQPVGTTFRLVVIPASHRLAHPEVNYNDFNEVKRVFGLKN